VITVDMRHMTPRLLAAAGELLGSSLMEAMQGPKQPLAIAAIAAVQHPEMSFDELADTDLTEFDIVNEDPDPKAQGASNGGAPQPSPAVGV
jgi:hypothetical protein